MDKYTNIPYKQYKQGKAIGIDLCKLEVIVDEMVEDKEVIQI